MRDKGKLMIVTEKVTAVTPYGCRYNTHKIHQKNQTDKEFIDLYRQLKASGEFISVAMYRETRSYERINMENYFIPSSELRKEENEHAKTD